MKYHSFNKRVVVHDERGGYVGDAHWCDEYEPQDGDELNLDQGGAIVQVAECVDRRLQDLSELVDKRIQERLQRHAYAKSRQSPLALVNASYAIPHVPPRPVQQPKSGSLTRVFGPPTGHHGRAHIPSESPYEIQHGRDSPQPKPRPQRPTPPSRTGYAQHLFGQTLTLSVGSVNSGQTQRPAHQKLAPLQAPSDPSGSTVSRGNPEPEIEEAKQSSSRPLKRRRRDEYSGYARKLFGTSFSSSSNKIPSASTAMVSKHCQIEACHALPLPHQTLLKAPQPSIFDVNIDDNHKIASKSPKNIQKNGRTGRQKQYDEGHDAQAERSQQSVIEKSPTHMVDRNLEMTKLHSNLCKSEQQRTELRIKGRKKRRLLMMNETLQEKPTVHFGEKSPVQKDDCLNIDLKEASVRDEIGKEHQPQTPEADSCLPNKSKNALSPLGSLSKEILTNGSKRVRYQQNFQDGSALSHCSRENTPNLEESPNNKNPEKSGNSTTSTISFGDITQDHKAIGHQTTNIIMSDKYNTELGTLRLAKLGRKGIRCREVIRAPAKLQIKEVDEFEKSKENQNVDAQGQDPDPNNKPDEQFAAKSRKGSHKQGVISDETGNATQRQIQYHIGIEDSSPNSTSPSLVNQGQHVPRIESPEHREVFNEELLDDIHRKQCHRPQEPTSPVRHSKTRSKKPSRGHQKSCSTDEQEATLAYLMQQRQDKKPDIPESSSICKVRFGDAMMPSAKQKGSILPKEPLRNSIPKSANGKKTSATCEPKYSAPDLPPPSSPSRSKVHQLPPEESSKEAPQQRKHIRNPATRGCKAAKKSDAAGLEPRSFLPSEPISITVPAAAIAPPPGPSRRLLHRSISNISTNGNTGKSVNILRAAALTRVDSDELLARDGEGEEKGRQSILVAPGAVSKGERVANRLPGFTWAREGPWTAEAGDLLGIEKPMKRK